MLRNLSDRSFDKRKASAMEVEKAVRKLRDAGNIPGVRAVLSVLATDFASSVNSNTRKGGLLALSTAAVGLGEDSGEICFRLTTQYSCTCHHLLVLVCAAQFSDVLLSPVLRAFNDSDSRLRYYACEAALNVCRVIRGAAYRHVSDLLAGICKLVADTDVEVKNGASLLDRLLKEIVCELGHIDAEVFIPLLRSHMTVNNPYVRQCLVGWITTLDSVPGIDMVDYMPDLLEGLFDMLGDGNREIRQQAYGALSKFLDQISKVPASTYTSYRCFIPRASMPKRDLFCR
jgi:vacuole morphology and inheritance protein 14